MRHFYIFRLCITYKTVKTLDVRGEVCSLLIGNAFYDGKKFDMVIHCLKVIRCLMPSAKSFFPDID